MEKAMQTLQQKYDDLQTDKVEKLTKARIEAVEELLGIEKHKNELLLKERARFDHLFAFQKPAHRPDLPLPLYLHVDDMKIADRSHSKQYEDFHKASIAEAFGKIKNHTLI